MKKVNVTIYGMYIMNEGPNCQYAKLGVSSGPFYTRLRMLNQGNWRDLHFSALYVGPEVVVKQFETKLKHRCQKIVVGGAGRTEWVSLSPKLLEELIDTLLPKSMFKLAGPFVPYTAKNKSADPFSNKIGKVYKEFITKSKFDFADHFFDLQYLPKDDDVWEWDTDFHEEQKQEFLAEQPEFVFL